MARKAQGDLEEPLEEPLEEDVGSLEGDFNSDFVHDLKVGRIADMLMNILPAAIIYQSTSIQMSEHSVQIGRHQFEKWHQIVSIVLHFPSIKSNWPAASLSLKRKLQKTSDSIVKCGFTSKPLSHSLYLLIR